MSILFLWWIKPSGIWNCESYIQLVGILGRGISSLQHRTTQTQKKCRHTSVHWVGFKFIVRVGKDISCPRSHGHCDWHITNIILKFIFVLYKNKIFIGISLNNRLYSQNVLFLASKNGSVGVHKYKRNWIYANGAVGFKKLLLAVFKALAVICIITCDSLWRHMEYKHLISCY